MLNLKVRHHRGRHVRSRHAKVFGDLAEQASFWAGTSIAFVVAIGFVVVWGLSGPIFRFSAHWEALITEIPGLVTFLLVFLIQNSQGREMRAIQLKLNELIRATDGAHTMMVNLENVSEEELALLCDKYERLALEARQRIKRGETDQHVVEMPLPEAAVKTFSHTLLSEEDGKAIAAELGELLVGEGKPVEN